MTDRDHSNGDDQAAERTARGLLRGWIVAKTTPWLVRLTVWATWIAAFAAYAGYVWWRVRRMLKAEEREAADIQDPAVAGSGSRRPAWLHPRGAGE